MAINKRYDFMFLFDVSFGNPNGDPDALGAPRVDPETGHGYVTNVCLKRKIRNMIALSKAGVSGHAIYVQHGAVLAVIKEQAYAALRLPTNGKVKGPDPSAVDKARAYMCDQYYDVRTFGAVMASKTAPAGKVRGPVQINFATSIDPITIIQVPLTRPSSETQEESERQGGLNQTMATKSVVPYALYRCTGHVSPFDARVTGFSKEDLRLLWRSLLAMFDHDRSSSRGLLSLRELYVFEHDTELGNAPSHKLFELLQVKRKDPSRPAREYADYEVKLGTMPKGVHKMEVELD